MRGTWRAVLLALCVAAAACTSSDETDRSATPTTPLTFPGSATEPDRPTDELQLEGLILAAESLRGLEFLEPMEIQLVGAAEYAERVEDLVGGDSRVFAPEQNNAWVRLFGLINDDTDIGALEARLLATNVAIYDPFNRQIVVHASSGLNPYVESVVVHELVHALQDQHFGLTPTREPADDAAYVEIALEEGDATRIERRFVGRISGSGEADYERGRLNAAEEALPLPATPPYVIESLTQPFEDGLGYVDRLSNEQADAAFLEPPPTSEQILHPGNTEPAREARLPPITLPSYQDLPVQTLGEAQLRLLLTQGVGDITAGVAASGWGGDSLQVQVLFDQVFFAYLFRGDSGADAEELATAFRLFLDRQLPETAHGSVRIDGDEVLVVAASDVALEAPLDEQLGDFGAEVFSEPE